jgi:hypothetical protein
MEVINLDDQHRRYAPNNSDVRRRLNKEASKSAASYRMLRCSDCELEFAWPMRSPNPDWYQIAYQTLPLYPAARWEFQACLDVFNTKDFVFEFGCGSGAFLEQCGQKSIKAAGVDFSSDAVEKCIEKGLDAFSFEVGQALPERHGQKASQIVAFHILEHLEQPHLLFERASQVAAERAQLWVAVPSSQRPSRQRRIRDYLDQPPHHMTRWSRSSLQRVGALNGWHLAEFRTEPMPLKIALWWIVTTGAHYQKWHAAGRLTNAQVERAVRYAMYPLALLRRLTIDRGLTGFSMLACYVRS